MTPHFRAFLVGMALLAGVVALCATAKADTTADISWTHPTQYTDNSPLPLANIARTEIEYGKCILGQTTFQPTPTPVIVQVAAPATTRSITGMALGQWCFRARTVTTATADNTSAWTGMAYWESTPVPPKPPALSVQ